MEVAESLYKDILLDHAQDPIGNEALDNPTHSAQEYNPSCGDVAICDMIITASQIEKIACRVEGCTLCKASGSMMCEMLSHKTLAEARDYIRLINLVITTGTVPSELEKTDFAAFSGVAQYPNRVKCVLLPWKALEQALGTNE